MTRANDRNKQGFPTMPTEDDASATNGERIDAGFDPTELDPWRERFDQSVPDSRDIDGELLQGRLLADLFGREPAEVAIGQYLIERRLGHGGMGEVYAGRDCLAGHEVAIKLLRPTDDVEHDRAQLIREARALAKIKHPNVIGLYHIGEHDNRLFIAMERVHGQTLAQWQVDRPRLSAILKVYAAAARGLAAAHRAGIVHGDFKPSNVLLSDDGRVLVSDFGVASVTEEHDELAGSAVDDRSARGGTLLFWAPERAAGRRGDGQSDQFSFFTALFRAVYGVGPVAGSNRAELLDNLCEGRLVLAPKTDRRVPQWLKRVFERGLAADPRRRFSSMDEVVEALERRARRTTLRVIGALGVVTSLLLAGRATVDSSPPVEIDPLAEIWSEDQRLAIESNSAIAGRPLIDALDEWADDWRLVQANHLDAPTRRCLAAGLGRFDELIDRLVEGGLSNRAAFVATAELPRPHACVGAPDAPPEDLPVEDRDAIARVLTRAELARLDLRFDESITLARFALERAEQGAWLGARVDALEQIGLALHDQRARAEAIATLEQARSLALRSAMFERAAELGVALALALGEDTPADRREHDLTLAEDLLLGAGTWADVRLQSRMAIARAREQMWRHAYADAESTLQRAITQLERDGSRQPYLQVELRCRLGDAIAAQGREREPEALRIYEQAIEQAQAQLEGRYERIEETRVWSNAGVAAFESEQYPLARSLFERALARRADLLAKDHPLVANSLTHLGHIDIQKRDWDAALERAESALAILSAPGVDQAFVGQAHGLAAMAYGGREQWPEALAAIDLAIAALPEDQPNPMFSIQRALFLGQLDRGEEAIATFAEALPAYESNTRSSGAVGNLVGVWIAWLELLNAHEKADLAADEFERISANYDIEDVDREHLQRAALPQEPRP